ncbi:MAG: superoxide dismutase [Clostridiales bacterium]|nr:superoxide dismutase [Clostridiales bacterium]
MNENNIYPFINLPLPYDYNALEPFIDEKTMHLHHDKHLQTYIDNLNAAIEKDPRLKQLPLKQLICYADKLPQPLQNAIRNNAGGVYNHRFYFDQLKNPSSDKPTGALLREINKTFGTFDKFKSELKAAALSVFGSGYAWLVTDGKDLKIITTPNQDAPLCYCPLMNIDVWEHAYYLKHYNVRADYIDDLLQIIDWTVVEDRFNSRPKK